MQDLIEFSRNAGELPANRFRVAISAGKETRTRDFDSLESAVGYATDIVSEVSESPFAAIVVNHEFAVVHRARPYYQDRHSS